MGALLQTIEPDPARREKLRRMARAEYATYVQLANPGFYMTRFHRFLCDKIQTFLEAKCTNGVMDILLLSVPPQHGKSFTVTETLPSWFLAKHPTDGVIIAGYNSQFAEGFNRRNRDKFNTIAQEIFLQSSPSGGYIHDCRPNDKAQGLAMWETMQGGRCRAAGLSAGITGYGAELFIIDDPIKNREDSESETIVSKIHDEMGPSVQSRIHPGGKLIVIQTRWIENDVIGWIQENWKEWIWETVNLPAEYDEEAAKIGPCPLGRQLGESLMGAHLGDDEDKMPMKIANTNRWLESKKRLVIASDGQRTWNALYQGRPTTENGNLFRADWWQYYSRTEDIRHQIEYMQLSIDATFKNTEVSDFVAMELWCLVGRKVYLWKLINKRMGFIDTIERIKRICKEFSDIDELVIEDKANGSAIMDVLRYETDIPPVVPVQPLGGKYARAQATSPFISTKGVYLPCDLTPTELDEIENDSINSDNIGVEIFVRQHQVFPYGKHDDMVDAQTQGLSRIQKLILGEIPMPEHKVYARYRRYYKDEWEDFDRMNEQEQAAYVKSHGAPAEWAGEDDDIEDPRQMHWVEMRYRHGQRY